MQLKVKEDDLESAIAVPEEVSFFAGWNDLIFKFLQGFLQRNAGRILKNGFPLLRE